MGALKRVKALLRLDPVAPRGAVNESDCLGIQPQSDGKFYPRLNTGKRPIAIKYRERKMKKKLWKESQTLLEIELGSNLS